LRAELHIPKRGFGLLRDLQFVEPRLKVLLVACLMVGVPCVRLHVLRCAAGVKQGLYVRCFRCRAHALPPTGFTLSMFSGYCSILDCFSRQSLGLPPLFPTWVSHLEIRPSKRVRLCGKWVSALETAFAQLRPARI